MNFAGEIVIKSSTAWKNIEWWEKMEMFKMKYEEKWKKMIRKHESGE
jgi:hypothetical protein